MGYILALCGITLYFVEYSKNVKLKKENKKLNLQMKELEKKLNME